MIVNEIANRITGFLISALMMVSAVVSMDPLPHYWIDRFDWAWPLVSCVIGFIVRVPLFGFIWINFLPANNPIHWINCNSLIFGVLFRGCS